MVVVKERMTQPVLITLEDGRVYYKRKTELNVELPFKRLNLFVKL
jgi:hypothetical protein